MRAVSAFASLLALILSACGGGAASQPEPERPPIPERTAAQDRAVRELVVDMVSHRICREVSGDLLGLSGDQPRSGAARDEANDPRRAGLHPKEGRFWVERCDVRVEGDRIAIDLGGRGWRWVQERTRKAGATFDLREHVRFRGSLHVEGTLDLAYHRERHVATIWFTPTESPRVQIVPTIEPDVEARGPWSRLLGIAMTVATADSLNDRGEQELRTQGSAQVRARLAQGLTLTYDLCTGQRDTTGRVLPAGAVPARPFESPAHEWMENERVRLRPGGIDLSGPFDGGGQEVRIDLEVEEGSGVRARMMCMTDAAPILEAYLDRRALPSARAQAEAVITGGTTQQLVAPAGAACPIVLVTEPTDQATVFRYLAYTPAPRPEPLVGCD